jgi:hypothetical protein
MVDPPTAEPTHDSPAARIIDDLLAGGDAVDDGAFMLDPVAAAAKLEAFAYADRSLYLIPIVEGLIGLGADAIKLDTRREDLLIAGRGISLERAAQWFLDLYSYALGSGADARGRAFGRLAVGLDMSLGDAAERVRRGSRLSLRRRVRAGWRATVSLRAVDRGCMRRDDPWPRQGVSGSRRVRRPTPRSRADQDRARLDRDGGAHHRRAGPHRGLSPTRARRRELDERDPTAGVATRPGRSRARPASSGPRAHKVGGPNAGQRVASLFESRRRRAACRGRRMGCWSPLASRGRSCAVLGPRRSHDIRTAAIGFGIGRLPAGRRLRSTQRVGGGRPTFGPRKSA